MRIFKNPEARGIAGLVIIILLVGLVTVHIHRQARAVVQHILVFGTESAGKIVFLSGDPSSAELCIMKTDGSGRKNLTSDAHITSGPAVNALGTRIAYVGTLGGDSQVLAARTDGSSVQQLTSLVGPKSRPKYSPDGHKLAFIAGGKVYVAQANGDSPEPVLPTDAQIHAAMTNPLSRETPVYTDYAWGPGGAMIGVTKDPADPTGSDEIVCLNGTGADGAALPTQELVSQIIRSSPTARLMLPKRSARAHWRYRLGRRQAGICVHGGCR